VFVDFTHRTKTRPPEPLTGFEVIEAEAELKALQRHPLFSPARPKSKSGVSRR
jgi:hypothetical protein